jgi:hypothetical protein
MRRWGTRICRRGESSGSGDRRSARHEGASRLFGRDDDQRAKRRASDAAPCLCAAAIRPKQQRGVILRRPQPGLQCASASQPKSSRLLAIANAACGASRGSRLDPTLAGRRRQSSEAVMRREPITVVGIELGRTRFSSGGLGDVVGAESEPMLGYSPKKSTRPCPRCGLHSNVRPTLRWQLHAGAAPNSAVARANQQLTFIAVIPLGPGCEPSVPNLKLPQCLMTPAPEAVPPVVQTTGTATAPIRQSVISNRFISNLHGRADSRHGAMLTAERARDNVLSLEQPTRPDAHLSHGPQTHSSMISAEVAAAVTPRPGHFESCCPVSASSPVRCDREHLLHRR